MATLKCSIEIVPEKPGREVGEPLIDENLIQRTQYLQSMHYFFWMMSEPYNLTKKQREKCLFMSVGVWPR